MRRRTRSLGVKWLAVAAVLVLVAAACGDSDSGSDVSGEGFKFGMILVGPQNDRGYSQAHFEGGQYVVDMLGAEMITIDKVNPADQPEVTVDQVARQMIDQGAQLIFATSDDMRDGAFEAARQNPDVPMIWVSGDSAWSEGKAFESELTNLGNVWGQMVFGKMIAGCAAALQSQTGQLAYLGPLINDETRRLVNSAYLGAQYCWEEYRGNNAADLDFEVNWIGFWFNIPGVTLDPTQVVNEFVDGGADVVLSGIDTTEALVRAGQRTSADNPVWAVPYDFEGACEEAPEVCLGVPYFNWGPSYQRIVESVIDGSFEADFVWDAPDWDDINDPDTSAIGFFSGDGLSDDGKSNLDDFIKGLGDGDIELYEGPLNWQDGSAFLGDGERASDFQIWYADQLLEGVVGASSS